METAATNPEAFNLKTWGYDPFLEDRKMGLAKAGMGAAGRQEHPVSHQPLSRQLQKVPRTILTGQRTPST